MTDILKETLQRYQTRTIDIFFRDDDVHDSEDNLLRLIDLFQEWDVPLNLEVMPGQLTDRGVETLREASRRLFELNQHGWRHLNHEMEGRKCEFGVSRNYDQQLNDIADGMRVMDAAFGAEWSKVFTPPWNRCTEDTFRALDHLGFEALSRDKGLNRVTGYGFREISICVDLHRWRGEPAMKSPESITSEIAGRITELGTIGIMLHHKVMDDTGFSTLAGLLESLCQWPMVRFHTFQSLIEKVGSGAYRTQTGEV